MYAVMGITGQVGGAVARTLSSAGHAVRGVVRDPAKARPWADRGVALAAADQADTAALTAAFRGVDGAFVMLPPMFAPTADFADARRLINALHAALADAAVPRVVALSTIGAEHTWGTGILKGLHLLEQSLATLAMPVAVVRAAWFMENASGDIQRAFDEGVLATQLQPVDRPVPMVSVEDVGRVAAETLARPWPGRRVIELEGPQRYAPADVATALAAVVRRVVRVRAVPREQWPADFEARGASHEAALLRAEMIDGFNTGHIDFVAGQVPGAEHVVGRVTLDEAITRLVAA